MNYKKIFCLLLVFAFLSSLVVSFPVFAAPDDTKAEKVYSYLAPTSEDKPQDKPGKPVSTATVDIRNIPSGDKLYGTVLIIAQATGTFSSVVYQIDNQGTEAAMTKVDASDRYQASWNTAGLTGDHTITVKAKDGTKDVATSSVSITVVDHLLYEVRYEVDYVVEKQNGVVVKSYLPDASVFQYLTNYWASHAVKVTFTPSSAVEDPTPEDKVISSTDFWTLENKYNDGLDNSAQYGYTYFSQDKWMLCGSYDTNTNVGGYTYVPRSGRDYVGGNYIFIAEGMIQNWEATNSIPNNGGSVIVVGHEAGHSIGIVVGAGGEKYDPDYYSIMSYMRLQNAKTMAPNWYYSKEYWAAANLGTLVPVT